MTDRPIIFSAPMVRALLEGRKTMTRRLAWHDPIGPVELSSEHQEDYELRGYDIARQPFHLFIIRRPTIWQRVKPGDRLWIRETHYVWSSGYKDGSGKRIDYRASTPDACCTWTPSIHMPRWASRLMLIVTATRIERLNEISETDAKAEGIETPQQFGWHCDFPTEPGTGYRPFAATFAALWENLHGAGSWGRNPEIIAITFDPEFSK